MDIHEIESWFVNRFGKGVEEVRADLESAKAKVEGLQAWAKAHAGAADAVIAAVEQAASAVDPAAGPAVALAVTAAKDAAAEANRLLDEVLAKV